MTKRFIRSAIGGYAIPGKMPFLFVFLMFGLWLAGVDRADGTSPDFEGVDYFGTAQVTQQWTTPTVTLAFKGVTGDPLWVDVDDNPAFDSPKSYRYGYLPPYSYKGSDPTVMTGSQTTSVEISPDGKYFLSCCDNNYAWLWEMETGKM